MYNIENEDFNYSFIIIIFSCFVWGCLILLVIFFKHIFFDIFLKDAKMATNPPKAWCPLVE